ncbi:MAG: pilus assembly protein CpaB [Acidobacteriaceae bacterium]|jgi:pilus assembly protein CpaB|nr:pilus assembly protein CpaB [Acidobacteriaceae bacterium]
MNRRLLNILLIAFVIAAACSYVVFRLVGSRLSGTRQTTAHVIAAATDIKLGSVLRDADLTTIEIAGTLPKGAILRREDAIGRGVLSNLYLGEPVLQSRLAAPGSGGGLAATIPKGMRATAVKVNEVVGVAGFVTPGMRVDVLITGNPPGAVNSGQGSLVRTLLQNIEVLSAGTDIQRDAEGKPQQVQVVNLLVTPTQAEILSLASNETRIQLVLRNPLDTNLDKPPGTATAQLFTDGNPPKIVVAGHRVSKPVTPRVYLVEIFNGSKKSETKFAANEDKDKDKQ